MAMCLYTCEQHHVKPWFYCCQFHLPININDRNGRQVIFFFIKMENFFVSRKDAIGQSVHVISTLGLSASIFYVLFLLCYGMYFSMWEADVIAQLIWRGLAWEIYFIFLCILIRLGAETNYIFWTKTNFVKILLIFILPFIKKLWMEN